MCEFPRSTLSADCSASPRATLGDSGDGDSLGLGGRGQGLGAMSLRPDPETTIKWGDSESDRGGFVRPLSSYFARETVGLRGGAPLSHESRPGGGRTGQECTSPLPALS